jgi:hypothetical protein
VRDVAVDDLLEKVEDPGSLEDLAAVRRGRHDRAAQPGLLDGAHVPDRALVGAHPVARDDLLDQLVLAVTQAADLLVVDLDAARGEEAPHAVVAGQAVDVAVVVVMGVELPERLARALRALAQVLVEQLLPGRGVHRGGLRQHAVEVEQAGPDGVGQAQHQSLAVTVSRSSANLRRAAVRRVGTCSVGTSPGGGA